MSLISKALELLARILHTYFERNNLQQVSIMAVKNLVLAALMGAALAAGASAQAAVLLQDDFDGDSASTVLNFNSLTNWTVSDGTIDYIRSGAYGIGCVGGTGGCLDMDGSTSNAGQITSSATFSLTAGVTYTLTAQISGNQRGGASDSLTLGLIDAATDASLSSFTLPPIDPGAAFSALGTYSLSITPVASTSVRVSFSGIGGDNIGPILDNVLFTDDTRPIPVSEPGTALLAGLGLLALALYGRRGRAWQR